MNGLLRESYDLIKEGQFEKAIEVLETILIEDPTHKEALCNIGIAFTESGENDKAIKALNYSMQLDSTNAEVYEALGCAYFRRQDFSKARDYFDKALELKPESASVLRNIGVLFSTMSRHDESYDYLKRSLEINPDDYRTMYALSIETYYTGDFQKTEGMIKQLLIMDIPMDVRESAVQLLKKVSR